MALHALWESGHRHKILAAFLSMRKWFGAYSMGKPKTGYYSAIIIYEFLHTVSILSIP